MIQAKMCIRDRDFLARHSLSPESEKDLLTQEELSFLKLPGLLKLKDPRILSLKKMCIRDRAAITMPIMAPLSDLLGVSRQTAVVAFQLGDAFTNLIVPTSGCLIGSLAIAKIEWSNWIKFMWKFLGVLMIGAIITVLVAVGIGF